MTPERYQEVRAAIIDAGYASEIEWAEGVKAPENAEDFAGEAVWVILCSGMKEQIARKISDKVWGAIRDGQPVRSVFGHDGKAAAIETIWRDRERLFQSFKLANDKVEFCQRLPWIGGITKWHLAKNYGVDCAKPDIHLSRLATHYGTTPANLCAALAKSSGDRIATVDLVIWRACNLEIIKTRELA
jgi:hypothetical protein